MSWEKVRLGDCCEITSSKRIFYSEYVDFGIPFYRSKEIIENSQGQSISEPLYISEQKYCEIKEKFGVPQTGDMLLTSVGTIGIPYIVKDSDCFYFKDGNLTWFRNFNGILASRFLCYWIKSAEGYSILNNSTIGSSQKALTISALKELSIPCPPIKTQNKIIDILSAYDNLIENNQKQIKLLEEAAQRLYKEWFVDLRFPGYENVPVVDGVPEGWRKTIIGKVCDTLGGGTPSTKNPEYYVNGRIKWVTPTDITKNGSLILLDSEKKITELGLKNSSAKLVPPYTILMTSRASIGFFGLCEKEVCTNQGFILCIPNNDNCRYWLLHNLMNRIDEIRQKASGSTFLEISKKTFREMVVVLPSDSVLEQYTNVILPLINQMEVKTKQVQCLTQARDRLLPKLMSGEIEV